MSSIDTVLATLARQQMDAEQAYAQMVKDPAVCGLPDDRVNDVLPTVRAAGHTLAELRVDVAHHRQVVVEEVAAADLDRARQVYAQANNALQARLTDHNTYTAKVRGELALLSRAESQAKGAVFNANQAAKRADNLRCERPHLYRDDPGVLAAERNRAERDAALAKRTLSHV